MKKRLYILILVGVFLAPLLWGESKTTVDLSLITGVSGSAFNDDSSLMATGSLRLGWKSIGVRNVKTEILLDATVGDMLMLDLYKAQIKMRFPGFRFTLGKTRTGWGVGNFYNSGDIIFTNPILDLTAEDLRSTTTWMGLVKVPISPTSFFEFIGLAPPFNLSEMIAFQMSGDPPGPAPLWHETGGGGRLFLSLDALTLQTGYIVDGTLNQQRTYVSLQGAIEWDIFAASSIIWDTESLDWSAKKENWTISAGTFSSTEIEGLGTLSWRAEMQYRPYGVDSSYAERLPTEKELLENYFELGFAPSPLFNLGLRSVIDWFDASARVTGTIYWNYDTGVSLFTFINANTGLDGRHYNFFGPNGWDLMIGVRSKF
jgi:hypothetical protein